MVQIKCLSNGLYPLKNSHIPFGKGFQPPPPLTAEFRLYSTFFRQGLPLCGCSITNVDFWAKKRPWPRLWSLPCNAVKELSTTWRLQLAHCAPPAPHRKKLVKEMILVTFFMEKLCKSTYIGMKNILGEFNKYLRVNDNLFCEKFLMFFDQFWGSNVTLGLFTHWLTDPLVGDAVAS